MNLKLDKIEIADLQARAGTDSDTVAEYADSFLEGEKFPPIIVFHDGTNYFLADGFHRYFGAKKAGLKDINSDVRKGSRNDALWFAVAANRSHGLKRTNADKRRSTELALKEKPELADNAIAKHVGVSQPLVSEVRAQLQVLEVDSSKTPAKRIGLDGKARSVSVPKRRETSAPVTPPPRKKPAVPVVAKPSEPAVICDEIGVPVPDALLAPWEQRFLVRECVTLFSRAKKIMGDAQEVGAIHFTRPDELQGHIISLEKMISEIKNNVPYCLCPDCRGKNLEQCTRCRHTGFIGKFDWEVSTTEEQRNIILGTVKK